jgi:hypothetical protein
MAQRSLYAVTEVYYRSMSCFASISPSKVLHAVLRILHQRPFLHRVGKAFHKVWCHFHSTEQDMLPTVFLISKQSIPYWVRGDTYCPGVSTPKIRSLAGSSTTCHDGTNHLHHSNHCSNHNINPYRVNSHLNGWKTTTLLQRHKPNSTSQRMEDLYDTKDSMAKYN